MTVGAIVFTRWALALLWRSRGVRAERFVLPVWLLPVVPLYIFLSTHFPVLWEGLYIGSWPPSIREAGKLCIALQLSYLAISLLPPLCAHVAVLVGLGNVLPFSYREGRYILKFSVSAYLAILIAWVLVTLKLLS